MFYQKGLIIFRLFNIYKNFGTCIRNCSISSFYAMTTCTSEEIPSKRARLDNNSGDINMRIGTHNGTFHCDEVLACYMLKLLPEYKDAEIVRTRDQATLDKCDIVVDVGAVYDPPTFRFDHHQRSFKESMNSIRPEKKWITKLSSAGLVYCHYGEKILKCLMKDAGDNNNLVNIIYDKMYEGFVEEIDAIDNGIDQSEGEARYSISTNLSARVGRLNPNWNEKDKDEMQCFEMAMKLVGSEFEERVKDFINVWLPARSIVEKSLKARHEVDPSGEIMKLERYCPWKEHLLTLEEENGTKEVKYVLYQDSSSKWRIQCVPAAKNTFENRLPIRQEWRGLRNEELSEVSGIPQCIFVHSSGFIGGNETYDGVLQMARKSLEVAE